MRSLLARLVWLSPLFVAAGCSNEGDPGPTSGDDAAIAETPDGGTGTGSVDCAEQVTEVQGAGGCVLTIVSPTNCETVDFSAGFVELAYTTNTTFCEGPHHLFLLGHPPSSWEAGNGMDITLSSTDGAFVSIGENGSSYAMTRNIGGVLRLARADLAPLMSPNGQFHFAVTGFYDLSNGGSRSASRTFVVPGF